jgi:hypothetical protein
MCYLSEALDPPPPPCYTLYEYIITYTPVLIHTGKGGGLNLREGRGALVHKRGRKYQHD